MAKNWLELLGRIGLLVVFVYLVVVWWPIETFRHWHRKQRLIVGGGAVAGGLGGLAAWVGWEG